MFLGCDYLNQIFQEVNEPAKNIQFVAQMIFPLYQQGKAKSI